MFKTVSFYTLGCRLNQAETAIIQRSFEQQGYDVLDFGAPTDLVVINTCTVTENGDADTRRLVNKVNRINSHARIALVGCQAQTQGAKLLQMPGVQWVVGNAVKMDLV
ncbi:MAG: tRNA (N(6)-L-threonylcarbamoyladenosine(37)-C(2))-methylthiotransferase MtaB, partial [Calditrichaeota bacterium]|nr:tRNA (N(6)-L-threonylcarbamoyladenosine(37)-C(2))-methylthiotransferase MtaB [Calditrichota bacterium]